MPNFAGALGVLGSSAGLLRNISRQSFKRNPGKTQYSTAPVMVRAEIDQFGIQKQNLGVAVISTPKVLANKYPKAGEVFAGLHKRIEQFNIPGTVIQTSEIRRQGYGPTSRVPVGNITSSNFTMTMIADQDGVTYEVMKEWMEGIVAHQGRGNAKHRQFDRPNNGVYLYEVSYKSDYATTITLLEFDDNFNTIISTDLIQAFPIAIQDKTVNWGSTGLVTFTVDFAYTASDTRIDNFEQVVNLAPKPMTALYASILKGAAILQSFSSAKRGGGIANVIGVVAAGAAALNTVGGLRR